MTTSTNASISSPISLPAYSAGTSDAKRAAFSFIYIATLLFIALASIVFSYTWLYPGPGSSIHSHHSFISPPLSRLHDAVQVIALIAIAFQSILAFSFAGRPTRHMRNRLKEGCILTSFVVAALALVLTAFLSTYWLILGVLDFRLTYSMTDLISMTSTDTHETLFSIYSLVFIGFMSILYLAIAVNQTMQAQVWLSMCSIAFAVTLLSSIAVTRIIDSSTRSFGFLFGSNELQDSTFGLKDGIQHADVRAAIFVGFVIFSWILYSYFSKSFRNNLKKSAVLLIFLLVLPSYLFVF